VDAGIADLEPDERFRANIASRAWSQAPARPVFRPDGSVETVDAGIGHGGENPQEVTAHSFVYVTTCWS
jgi:hypothetical protein